MPDANPLDHIARVIADLVLLGRDIGAPLRSVSIDPPYFDELVALIGCPVHPPHLLQMKSGIRIYRSIIPGARGVIYPHFTSSLN